MCIGFFLHKGQLSKWAMMNVTCLDDASIKLLNKYGAKIRISDYEKFPVLVFSNNPVENANNLKRLVMECKALIQAHAYGKGITVRFEDNATYKDWVDVLDTVYRLEAMGFAPYENKVYFLLPKPVPPQKNAFVPFCGTSYWQMLVDDNAELPFYDKLKNNLKPLSSFWPSLIPLTLMIFFSLRKRRIA